MKSAPGYIRGAALSTTVTMSHVKDIAMCAVALSASFACTYVVYRRVSEPRAATPISTGVQEADTAARVARCKARIAENDERFALEDLGNDGERARLIIEQARTLGFARSL